jgi:hypothetical protein
VITLYLRAAITGWRSLISLHSRTFNAPERSAALAIPDVSLSSSDRCSVPRADIWHCSKCGADFRPSSVGTSSVVDSQSRWSKFTNSPIRNPL